MITEGFPIEEDGGGEADAVEKKAETLLTVIEHDLENEEKGLKSNLKEYGVLVGTASLLAVVAAARHIAPEITGQQYVDEGFLDHATLTISIISSLISFYAVGSMSGIRSRLEKAQERLGLLKRVGGT